MQWFGDGVSIDTPPPSPVKPTLTIISLGPQASNFLLTFGGQDLWNLTPNARLLCYSSTAQSPTLQFFNRRFNVFRALLPAAGRPQNATVVLNPTNPHPSGCAMFFRFVLTMPDGGNATTPIIKALNA